MMDKFTEVDRQNLLAFLRRGRENAIRAEVIAHHMGYPTTNNQVKTRRLILECIDLEGDLIGSIPNQEPKGYFLINTVAEVNPYLDSLRNRAFKIINRRNRLIESWNADHPGDTTNRATIEI